MRDVASERSRDCNSTDSVNAWQYAALSPRGRAFARARRDEGIAVANLNNAIQRNRVPKVVAFGMQPRCLAALLACAKHENAIANVSAGQIMSVHLVSIPSFQGESF